MIQPLPFFAESSFAFQSELPFSKEGNQSNADEHLAKALIKAKVKWYPGKYNSGAESESSANKLCFRTEPFEDPDFQKLAGEIYGPMLGVIYKQENEGE